MTVTDNAEVIPRKLVAPEVALPRYAAVERLSEVLQKTGFTTDAAKAIAAVVVDPSAFRRALDTPLTVRVPGGTLALVPTRLWAPGVILHPTNTRISPWLDFPAAGSGAGRPIARPVAVPDGRSQLKLIVDSRDDLVDNIGEAARRLEAENNLDADIAADSVREPITAVVVTIEHNDDEDTDPVTLLVAADGSSRVAATHRNLHISADAAIYRYAVSGKTLRERVGRTLRLRDHGDSEIDEDDIAELNSLTLPAMVVVGFEADPDSDIDFARAIDARVGSIHVSPPKIWSEAAKLDAQLNAVLDELSEEFLDETYVAYYAGQLSPEEAARVGLTPLPDVRAADILSDLHRRKLRGAIHDALRSVGLHNVTYENRADIAAEAALRSFRSSVTGTEAASARLLLRHLYRMEILRQDWSVDRERTLEDLRDAALAELRSKGPRTATPELLAYAIFWLARKNLVRRATRGKDPDRTDISVVIGKMSTTKWGIHALYRIVLDMRSDRPLRRVDQAGRVVKSARDLPETEDWIRSIWGAGGRADEVVTPEVQLGRAREEFEMKMKDAKEAFANLLKPIIDSKPLVEVAGVPAAWAGRLIAVCSELQGELTYYRRVAARDNAPPADAEDLPFDDGEPEDDRR